MVFLLARTAGGPLAGDAMLKSSRLPKPLVIGSATLVPAP